MKKSVLGAKKKKNPMSSSTMTSTTEHSLRLTLEIVSVLNINILRIPFVSKKY